MATTTTHTCDICNKQIDWKGKYRVSVQAYYPGAGGNFVVSEKDACRGCMEKLGVMPPEKKPAPNTPPPPPPTFEDMIRNIVREETANGAH